MSSSQECRKTDMRSSGEDVMQAAGVEGCCCKMGRPGVLVGLLKTCTAGNNAAISVCGLSGAINSSELWQTTGT